MNKIFFVIFILLLSGSLLASNNATELNKNKKNSNVRVLKSSSKDNKEKIVVRSKNRVPQKSINSNTFCRVCCTVSIPFNETYSVGFTACAGNFLTGCEAAGDRACDKAYKSIFLIMADLVDN